MLRPRCKKLVVLGLICAATGLIVHFVSNLDGTRPFRTIGLALGAGDLPRQAEYILALNGNIAERSLHAARLYHQGWADALLIVQTSHSIPGTRGRPPMTAAELLAYWLVRRGVPVDAISILPGAAGNTIDEARVLRAFVTSQAANHVIVATTDYHAGRARWIFARQLTGTRSSISVVVSRSSTGITPENWWRSRQGWRRYSAEAGKWLGARFLLAGKPETAGARRAQVGIPAGRTLTNE
jgi:uncharacterized SAM-binding protein YcdF (DUF218 family)